MEVSKIDKQAYQLTDNWTNRNTDRQADRQTDRQRDRQTNRETDTEKQTNLSQAEKSHDVCISQKKFCTLANRQTD